MEDERVISYERGKQLAEQLGVEFFETSAKENINVKVTCQKNVPLIQSQLKVFHVQIKSLQSENAEMAVEFNRTICVSFNEVKNMFSKFNDLTY